MSCLFCSTTRQLIHLSTFAAAYGEEISLVDQAQVLSGILSSQISSSQAAMSTQDLALSDIGEPG